MQIINKDKLDRVTMRAEKFAPGEEGFYAGSVVIGRSRDSDRVDGLGHEMRAFFCPSDGEDCFIDYGDSLTRISVEATFTFYTEE